MAQRIGLSGVGQTSLYDTNSPVPLLSSGGGPNFGSNWNPATGFSSSAFAPGVGSKWSPTTGFSSSAFAPGVSSKWSPGTGFSADAFAPGVAAKWDPQTGFHQDAFAPGVASKWNPTIGFSPSAFAPGVGSLWGTQQPTPNVSGVGGGVGSGASPTNTGAPGSTMPSPQLSSYGSDPTSQLGVGGVPGATNYPISSPSIGYNPTYGGIPGPIGIPNPFQDLSGVLPGLGGLNKSASNNVLSELSGQLSPGTMALLQDKSAQFGVGSGMPGSGLARNRNLRDLGLTSEALSTQGLADYNRLVGAVSGTQTVPPSLQAEIAARNANMNAAPLPSAAQSYAQQLFDKYLQNMRGPGGGGNSLFGPQSGTGSQGPLGLGGVNAAGLGFGFGQAGQGYNPGGVPPSSSGQDFSGLSEADFENMMFGFDPSQANAYPPEYTDPSWDPGTDGFGPF